VDYRRSASSSNLMGSYGPSSSSRTISPLPTALERLTPACAALSMRRRYIVTMLLNRKGKPIAGIKAATRATSGDGIHWEPLHIVSPVMGVNPARKVQIGSGSRAEAAIGAPIAGTPQTRNRNSASTVPALVGATRLKNW